MNTTTKEPSPELVPEPDLPLKPGSLRIVRLAASNIKRLKAVEIVPEGDLVVIAGKNDQGKTSVLDAISYAIAGKDAICERPIREGASKAQVICDLQEIVVTRKFTASGGTTLTVTAADGTPLKSPQAILDSLCSQVAFDPLSFVRLKAAEQKETLRKLVGLDFTALDMERRETYDRRTVANRELASAEAKLGALPLIPGAPADEVKVSDLMAELESVRNHNAENQKVKAALDQRQTDLVDANAGAKEAESIVESLKKQLIEAQTSLEQANQAVKDAYERRQEAEQRVTALVWKDEQPIKARMEELDTLNAKVRQNRRHKELAAEVASKREAVDQLTNRIEAIDQEKTDKLTGAKFPLPGLSFDDTGVLLNGVPFSQGSQARQLQAAVAIGLALNPRLRVITIKDASLLDEDSMKLMGEIAAKNDAQIWLEVVGESSKASVIIEDGKVKE